MNNPYSTLLTTIVVVITIAAPTAQAWKLPSVGRPVSGLHVENRAGPNGDSGVSPRSHQLPVLDQTQRVKQPIRKVAVEVPRDNTYYYLKIVGFFMAGIVFGKKIDAMTTVTNQRLDVTLIFAVYVLATWASDFLINALPRDVYLIVRYPAIVMIIGLIIGSLIVLWI